MSFAYDNNVFEKKDLTRIHMEDPRAADKLARELAERLPERFADKNRAMVLLCIGTDRSTGDCLGPLVGSKMVQSRQDFYTIYGTLEKPVHAGNLKERLQEISSVHPDPFVIAIDACLGRIENVGCITVGNGSLLPGAGVNKDLPAVGQLHITGIVNIGGFMEFMVLQNTRLSLVMKLADVIAGGLRLSAEQLSAQCAAQRG